MNRGHPGGDWVMNKHTIVHAVLGFSLAVSFILQPAKTNTVYAEGAVRRVVPGGSVDPACGGGWDLASPNPALRPCDLQTALDTSAMLDEIWAAEVSISPPNPPTRLTRVLPPSNRPLEGPTMMD